MLTTTRFTFSLAILLALPLYGAVSKAHDDHGSERLGVEIQELANSIKQWNGITLPKYPSGQPQIKILRIKIPSGVTLPRHYHPVINAAVILEGTLELYLANGTRKKYRKGEALIEVINTIHFGKAVGTEPVDLIVFYAGEQNKQTTILSK